MTSFIDAIRQEQEGTNKPLLKVAYTDFWPEWPEENFVEPILRKHFYVEIDQKNPDVLFHSVFNRMSETPKYKCKKVLVLAENWRSSQIGSNYSISFDPHSETNFRLPLWQIYLLLWPELKDRLYNRLNHENFDRFCSFVVSNGSNFMRNSMFQQLNSYKRVHSYGRFMTNDLSLQKLSQGKYWRDAKDQFFLENKHKFAITYENTPYPGYCTEKLMDGFLAGSMPIYWGDPKVVIDWNNDAFINATKLGTGVVEEVKKIDQDDILFRDMYQQPIFKENQQKLLEENLEEFENWLITVIEK